MRKGDYSNRVRVALYKQKNLDYSGVKQVNALVRNLKAQGKTVIILTHEIEKCLGLSDHFIVLFRGEKVFDGKPEEGIMQNLVCVCVLYWRVSF